MSRRNRPRSFVGSLSPLACRACPLVLSGRTEPSNKLRSDQLQSVGFPCGWYGSGIPRAVLIRMVSVPERNDSDSQQDVKATAFLPTFTGRSLALLCWAAIDQQADIDSWLPTAKS